MLHNACPKHYSVSLLAAGIDFEVRPPPKYPLSIPGHRPQKGTTPSRLGADGAVIRRAQSSQFSELYSTKSTEPATDPFSPIRYKARTIATQANRTAETISSGLVLLLAERRQSPRAKQPTAHYRRPAERDTKRKPTGTTGRCRMGRSERFVPSVHVEMSI